MPVRVARITQPKAPASTATKNDAARGVPAAKRPVLKLLINPPASQKERRAPAAVVRVAKARAWRGRAAPNPTRVATPLQLSLAPLAKARRETSRRIARRVMVRDSGRGFGFDWG